MVPVIAVFGEMLWDMLPSGKQPGGAPMNVAIHLKNFGINPQFISRVGDDDLGRELMKYLAGQQLSTTYIQTGITHLTGIVKVNLTDRTEVTYKIVQPVAWDYIQLTPENVQLVKEADVFVYGTLAARSAQSRETLYALLDDARLKVFDVNVRPPHFDRETAEHLLEKADIVKLNEHELAILAEWFDINHDVETQMKEITERFDLKLMCVTLGKDGAIATDGSEFYRQSGYSVEVQDTIGSGDSFLAMFLTEYLQGTTVAEALKKACAVGAIVATYNGATPAISRHQLKEFISVHS
jgi:fructokinase